MELTSGFAHQGTDAGDEDAADADPAPAKTDPKDGKDTTATEGGAAGDANADQADKKDGKDGEKGQGAVDGSLQAVVQRYEQHKSWVVDVHLQQGSRQHASLMSLSYP